MTPAFYEHVALWSQVGGAVAFLAVLVLGWFRFITPAVIAARDKKNADLVEAEHRRDAARAEVDAVRTEVESAGADAGAIRARAERDAVRLRERSVGEAALEGERVVRNAEGELERGRAAAHERLRDELLGKALEIARTSAASLGESADRKLFGDVVDALEKTGR